jgi:hypothetical protein
MPTHEIPRQEWPGFCQTFTRQHRGALVTLEIRRPGEAPSVEAQSLPFQRLSLDVNDSGSAALHITIGRTMEKHLIHLGLHAMRVLCDNGDAGAQAGLTLEKRDGTQTRLQFREPAIPEALDGLMMPPE